MRAYARAGAPRQRCRDDGGRWRRNVSGSALETAAARNGRGGVASSDMERDAGAAPEVRRTRIARWLS